ncbi:MAG TPA: hypothetical protein VJ343_02415 [archaeon]|nr:hypothetical protein [archaeon]
MLFFLLLIPHRSAFAASSSNQGLGCGGGFGPIAELFCGADADNPDTTGNALNRIVSNIIGFLTIVGGLWFGWQIITAGFDWIGSAGDKSKLETAKHKLTNALVGILVIAAAWVIMGVIGLSLGLEILNPGAVLKTIGF